MAPEVQGSSTEAIQELVDDKRMPYTVTKGIRGPSLSRGIPHMAVFDTEGALVWMGHPEDDEAEKAIKAALKDASAPASSDSSGLPQRQQDLVEERSWTNSDGKQIVASLVSLEGNTGQFKFSDGRPFEYDITQLSAEDQEVIKKASDAAPAE